MSLTSWNAFVEVCRTGSFRAAAATTGFSQPGLSRQVAALERAMGVRLLHRGARGVTPTAAGASLLPHARLVVSEARRGRDAARSASGRPKSIVLGAVPSATASLVPRAIAALRTADGPDVTVVSRLTPVLGPMVLARELDAAVVTDAPPGLPRESALRAIHLGDDEAVVVAPTDHRLAGSEPVDLRQLADETWIEDNEGSQVALRQLAARAGFDPHVAFAADDLIGKTGMVAAGLGVALVPGLLLPALRADLAIIRVRRSPRRGVYLLARKEGPRSEDLEAALRDALPTTFEPVVDREPNQTDRTRAMQRRPPE